MPQVSLLCSAKICLLNKVLVENNLSKGDAEWLLQLWLIGSSFFKWKDSQDINFNTHLLNSWLITVRVLVWLCQGLRDSYNQNRRDSSFYHREGLGKDSGLKLEPLSWENGSFPVVSLWGAIRNPALQMNWSSLHPEDLEHLSVCRGRVRGSQEWNLYCHRWLLSAPKKWALPEFYSSTQHWWPFEFKFELEQFLQGLLTPEKLCSRVRSVSCVKKCPLLGVLVPCFLALAVPKCHSALTGSCKIL